MILLLVLLTRITCIPVSFYVKLLSYSISFIYFADFAVRWPALVYSLNFILLCLMFFLFAAKMWFRSHVNSKNVISVTEESRRVKF